MNEPPGNPDAEQALIGAILFDPDRLADVADWFHPAAMTTQRTLVLYQAAVALRASGYPLDFVTLTNLLKSRGKLIEAGGYDGIARLFASAPASSNARHYAEIVMGHALRRTVIETAYAMADRAADLRDPIDVDELAARLRTTAAPYRLPSNETVSFADSLPAHRDRILDLWNGLRVNETISTGFKEIDALMLGGFRSGDLAYLGGRPGLGKTTLALQIAMTCAATGKRAVFVELEMSRDAVLNRAISIDANVPFGVAYEAIGDLAQRERWLDASERLESLPIDLVALRTTATIAAHCERQGAGLVIIDHLDYLRDPDLAHLTAVDRTTETSKRLRILAQGLGCPVVALSQLNRQVEASPPFKPALEHFRNSGAVEQDADYAFLLYRRKHYVEKGKIEAEPEDFLSGSSRTHRVELLLAKNRNGPVSPITLGWIPDQMKFVEERSA